MSIPHPWRSGFSWELPAELWVCPGWGSARVSVLACVVTVDPLLRLKVPVTVMGESLVLGGPFLFLYQR